MREYESLCIPPIRDLSPREIKQIRLHEKVSQAIFAKYLNTSTSTVRQWEQGGKHPRAPSAKAAATPLLSMIPPEAMTGMLTASTICGTLFCVPLVNY